MNLVESINKIKTRRKDSMLQRLSKIKYFLVLVVLLALPMFVLPTQANAGVSADSSFGIGQRLIDQTDMGAFRLVYFVDTRQRQSLVQVTNTTSRGINIHVQLFDLNNAVQQCNQCDFPDMLTPNDTHVYDVSDMMSNSGPGLPPPASECGLDDDHYGFVVISFTNYKDGGSVCGAGQDGCHVEGGPLIGMFRIIDESGYEYRTNAAGKEVLGGDGYGQWVGSDEEILVRRDGRKSWDDLVNFELADGNNLADLVGITFWELTHDVVAASPLVGTSFGLDLSDPIFIYRENETGNSCGGTTFTCAPGNFDKGIDQSLPNSLGQVNEVCTTSRLPENSSGWLHMPFSGFSCQPPLGDASDFKCNDNIKRNLFFVGFVGLNNGDGTGSMDSWWSIRPKFTRKQHDMKDAVPVAP